MEIGNADRGEAARVMFAGAMLDPQVCENVSCFKTWSWRSTLNMSLNSHSARALLNATVAVVLIVVPALSHDYWFEPEQFFVSVGNTVGVHLFVGEGLKADEERVLQMEKTPRFQMFSSEETQDLKAIAKDGQMPVAQVTFKTAGNYLIAMERNWSAITLDAKKFTEYLRDEGLDSIVAQRDQSGEANKEARERYSRYLNRSCKPAVVKTRLIGERQASLSRSFRRRTLTGCRPGTSSKQKSCLKGSRCPTQRSLLTTGRRVIRVRRGRKQRVTAPPCSI